MKEKNLLCGCLVLALFGFVGCDDDSGSSPGDVTMECNPACTEGQSCVDGECKAAEPETKDCNPACDEEIGESCVDGECKVVINEDDPGDPGEGSKEDPITDELAAMSVTPVDGIVTIQGKLNAGFAISLSREPSKVVTIPVKSLNTEAGTLSTDKVVFTPENWDTMQLVTIKAGTVKLAENPVDYTIEVGPSESEDAGFDEMEKVDVHVSHYSLEAGNPGDILPGALKLDKKSADILLKGSAVSFTASFDRKDVTDPCINIAITNETDDVAVKELVDIQHGECEHTVTIKSIVVPNNAKCIEKKLDLARTLKLTASHSSGKTASATIELKPYMQQKLTLTNLREVRDFTTQGHKKVYAKGKFELGEMACNYYDDHTIQVLNHDLIMNYVEPNMYKVGDDSFGTRASVVAAARFLVTQFPKDIPYASSSLTTSTSLMDDSKAGKLKYNVPTIANYTWTVRDYREDRASVRVYGLNLSSKAYNTYSLNPKESNIILGGKDQKEALPWGCAAKNADGSAVTSKNNTNATNPDSNVIPYPKNGLCCSGFVSWTLHNGRFYLGNFTTSLFAIDKNNKMCVDKDGKQLRNYLCKDYLDSNTGVLNGNGAHFNAFEKLNQLKESDFVKVSSLNNNSDIKAGDLLWFGAYTCPKKSDDSCSTAIEKCTWKSGHVGMILGISRTKEKAINKVYVAESSTPAGNHLEAYTIDNLRKTWLNGIANQSDCTVKDSRLIKMDKVYNYYYNKKKSDAEFIKGLDGKDFNTYKYTELWF